MGVRTGIESFYNKVELYKKGRPGYPEAALDFLMREARMDSSMTVADIGAGTGLLTNLLRRKFAQVIAVEPNDEMRATLSPPTLPGSAEATGLSERSVDAIFAAQAFHWFDAPKARAEFERVLKGPRAVFLLWNDRLSEGGAIELDDFLKKMRAEGPVQDRLEADPDTIEKFFAPKKLRFAEFANDQFQSEEEVRAMVLSRSYAPRPGEPRHPAVIRDLGEIFKRNAENGKLKLPYRTLVYWTCF